MKTSPTAKTVLMGLVDRMRSGDVSSALAKTYLKTGIDKPSDKWSRTNRTLMLLAGTSDARGYRQWLQVGRQVQKGCKAAYILAPMISTVTKPKDDKNNDDKKVARRIFGFRAVPVFRVEDTTGEPLPAYTPDKMPPLFGLAEYNGIDVSYIDSVGGEYGSISVPAKKMTLSTESADTYLHELVHYYDLRDREDAKGGQDPTQEIVAQLGACALAEMYGIDATAYSAEYIEAYATTEDDDDKKVAIGRACLNVIDRVGVAIDQILIDATNMALQKTDTTLEGAALQ